MSEDEQLAAIDLLSTYTTFSPAEVDTLTRFAEKAKELQTLQFITQGSAVLSITMGDGGLTYELGPDVSRGVVNAALVPLRLLYSRGNSVAFANTVGVLVEHIDEASDDADALRSLLTAYRENSKTIFDNTPIRFADGTNADGTQRYLEGRQIFEDWLYGEYLHDEELRRLRIEPFRLDGAHEYTFLYVAWSLAVNYIVFSRLFVEPLLQAQLTAEPES